VTGSHEPTTPPPVPPPPPAPPGWSTGPTGRAPQGAPPAPGGSQPAADVPDLDDRDRTLDRRVITVWRFSTVTSMLLPTGVLTAVAVGFLGSPTGWVVPAVLVLLTAVLAAWYPTARYERWRWRLTDLAVELERGVVVRQAEALPYFRIQQIDVTQGPIDRLLGLASLQVTSASASGSVTLPGIAAGEAPGIRRALLARASSAVQGRDTGVRDAV
jgi:uncharacterized protein